MYLTTKYVSSPFNNTSQGPLLACHMFLYFSVVIVHIFCILLVKTIKHIIISYYHRIAVIFVCLFFLLLLHHHILVLHNRAESHSIVHDVIHKDGSLQRGHGIDRRFNQSFVRRAHIHHPTSFVLLEVLAVILAIVDLKSIQNMTYYYENKYKTKFQIFSCPAFY